MEYVNYIKMDTVNKEVEYAGFWLRFYAKILDVIIGTVICLPAIFVLFIISFVLEEYGLSEAKYINIMFNNLVLYCHNGKF